MFECQRIKFYLFYFICVLGNLFVFSKKYQPDPSSSSLVVATVAAVVVISAVVAGTAVVAGPAVVTSPAVVVPPVAPGVAVEAAVEGTTEEEAAAAVVIAVAAPAEIRETREREGGKGHTEGNTVREKDRRKEVETYTTKI